MRLIYYVFPLTSSSLIGLSGILEVSYSFYPNVHAVLFDVQHSARLSGGSLTLCLCSLVAKGDINQMIVDYNELDKPCWKVYW